MVVSDAFTFFEKLTRQHTEDYLLKIMAELNIKEIKEEKMKS